MSKVANCDITLITLAVSNTIHSYWHGDPVLGNRHMLFFKICCFIAEGVFYSTVNNQGSKNNK